MESISQYEKPLNFVKLSDKACIPKKATSGSAGMDLCACIENDIEISPGELVKIPCGIAISLPSEEYAAFIFARSGLGIKHGITLSNGVGVVDSDYRGEICVGLCNVSDKKYKVCSGDRIAQMVIIKVENFSPTLVESLDDTTRGTGGFGSTGK